MILSQTKLKLVGIVALAGVALLGVEACGGNSPLPPPDTTTASTEDSGAMESLGTATVTVKDGHMTIGPLTPDGDGAGQQTQGFGPLTTGTGLVSFPTVVGDGVGTGTCTTVPAQYCAQQQATNNTGRLMDNMFVEITDYFGTTPAGTTITWAGTPFTNSTAYSNLFVNSGAIQAADYGSFTIGQTKTVEFKFNIGVATNFNFHIKVYGSFRRTTVGSSFVGRQAAVDACVVGGHVLALANTNDAEAVTLLPFPFTLYDITYDNVVMGANGYALFYKSGTAPPTQSRNNSSLLLSQPAGLYPFWDDLSFSGVGNGVCFATTGVTPNRNFFITWKNAHVNTAQPASPGTPSAETITFSLILQETADTFTFAYSLPSTITDLMRGISATTGEHEIRGGGQTGVNYSFNADSGFIPALSTTYPVKLARFATPANP